MKKKKNYFKGFEEKVKAMTAKEIILALVDGMQNPVMKVKMETYGDIDEHGVCYGCCATNMICKVANVKPIEVLNFGNERPGLSHHGNFLDEFEYAIDALRGSYFDIYNRIARNLGFAEVKCNITDIPPAFTDYNYNDPDHLDKWIELANNQK